MRDSMIIYRSFYEAIKDLPKETQANILSAVFEYGMDEIRPELTGVESAIFMLIKPQIDANNKRYENGKRGGRPKPNNNQTETETKPKENQTITKPKPNNNQSITKVEPNVNVNVNDNVNVNVNDNANGNVNDSLAAIAAHINFKKQTEQDFINEMRKFENLYARDMLNTFYQYWSEKDTKGVMRFQKEKTWELDKRLIRWKSKQKEYGTKPVSVVNDFIAKIESIKK